MGIGKLADTTVGFLMDLVQVNLVLGIGLRLTLIYPVLALTEGVALQEWSGRE